MQIFKDETIKRVNIQLKQKDLMIKFVLELNEEQWGSYKKGDQDDFYIKLLDENNGLIRYPIDARWTVISCELVNV